MSSVTFPYKVLNRCKHSIRMTPSKPDPGIRLPDLYLTHDLLDEIGVVSYTSKDFELDIKFSTKE